MISAVVASKTFHRILVDTRSSIDVLFKSTLDEISIIDLKLESTSASLKGFSGGMLSLLSVVELPVTIGSTPSQKIMMLDFVIVDEDSLYQIILGRLFLRVS